MVLVAVDGGSEPQLFISSSSSVSVVAGRLASESGDARFNVIGSALLLNRSTSRRSRTIPIVVVM